MAQPRVFISHSHKDNAFVTGFVEDLRKAGVSVWVDLSEIKHSDFLKMINEGLDQSDWCVLVLSPNSVPKNSPYVEIEVNAAHAMVVNRQLKAVIPFIIAPYDARDVPPTWRTLHAYDMTAHGYEAALAGLLKAIGATKVDEEDRDIAIARAALNTNEVIPDLAHISQEAQHFIDLVMDLNHSKTLENAFRLLEEFESATFMPVYGGLVAARAMGDILWEDLQISGPAFTQRKADLVMQWWHMLDSAGDFTKGRQNLGMMPNKEMVGNGSEADRLFTYLDEIIWRSFNIYDQKRVFAVLANILNCSAQMKNFNLRRDMFLRQITPRLLSVIGNFEDLHEPITDEMFESVQTSLESSQPFWLRYNDPTNQDWQQLTLANLNTEMSDPELQQWFRPYSGYIELLAREYGLGNRQQANLHITKLLESLRNEGATESGIEKAAIALAKNVQDTFTP